ncbi:MAG TPA: hypothetical protein VIF62_28915, partial [Labilithrix sp.]
MRTTILSLLFAFTVACGGGTPEPKTPATDNADTTAASTDTPSTTDPAPAAADKSPDPPKSAPVKTSAVSNTADGSDIVPPFTASKDDTASTTQAATKDDSSQTPAPAKKKGKAK